MAERPPRFTPEGSARPHNPRGRSRGVAPTAQAVEEHRQRIESLSLVNVQRGGSRSPGGSSGESRYKDDDDGNGNGNGGNGNGGNGSSSSGNGKHSPTGVRGSVRPQQIVKTKPTNINSKKGESGDHVELIVNYFAVQRKKDPSGGTWKLYQYHVSYEPDIDSKRLRRGLLNCIAPDLGPHISIDGTEVYTARPIPGGARELIREVANQRDQTPYTMTVTLKREVNPTDTMYIKFYNILMKKCQQLLKLTEMGRNFFDPEQKKSYPQYKLDLWPGFITVMRQYENAPLLLVEVLHKVVRTETVLECLAEFRRQFGVTDEMKRKAEAELVGAIIMTEYNKKTYRIDEIAWNRRPTETFDRRGVLITFAAYLKEKYNLDCNPAQPLIVSNPKKKDIHRGMDKPFVLLPQFCRMTGLTDKLRSNFAVMKELNTHLQMVPETRVNSIRGFVNRLNSDEATKDNLFNWGLRVAAEPLRIQGRVMPAEKLSFGGRDPIFIPDEKADWTMAFRNKPMLSTVPLQKWVIIVTERDSQGVDNLINTMQRVSRPLNFPIANPVEIIKIRSPTPKEYVDAVRKAMGQYQGKLDMIFVILATNQLPPYQAVKKSTYIEYGIPSQCFLAKNVNNAKGLMSIATKCVIQMNAKLGGEPWSIDVPLKNMMIVGFDVYHGSTGDKKGQTVGAMCATISKNATRYFSTISYHGQSEELSHNICANITKCLTAYKKVNNVLPGRILFYRDGVGEGQTQYVYATELENLKSAILNMYQSEGLEMPQLTFIVCTKRINTRILLPKGSRIENPRPGTVVDDTITLPERYDFFIVAQSVRQATVSPTSYNVLTDNSGLTPDKIQRITYKLCHGYYNWSGTVAVPAPVQYAHKLAFLTGTALGAPSHLNLNEKFYYL